MYRMDSVHIGVRCNPQDAEDDRRSARNWSRANAALLGLTMAVALLQFFLAPLILPMGAWTALALICLCAVATPLHWGLMHESIHGNLFHDPALNRRAGRVLGNFLLLSWDVMRFGHLLHHSNNRHEFDRPEAVPPGGTRLTAAGPYYLKLLGGHALISAVSSIGLALPAHVVTKLIPKAEPMRTAALRAFTNKQRQARIRVDLCVTIVLVTVAVFCWGAHWPIFAATIAARFFMLSLLDNAPHYGTAINSGTYARNTSLPRWAHWLVMGHNFHGIHHGATGLKWHELRATFASTGCGHEGSWTAMVLRQFRGPVYLDQSGTRSNASLMLRQAQHED
jgi:fatty acid desaturase